MKLRLSAIAGVAAVTAGAVMVCDTPDNTVEASLSEQNECVDASDAEGFVCEEPAQQFASKE